MYVSKFIQNQILYLFTTVKKYWDPNFLIAPLTYSGQWRNHEFCFFWGGVSKNSVKDRGQRERGSGGCSPLVRGSGGSCNLVQEVAAHMVKFS